MPHHLTRKVSKTIFVGTVKLVEYNIYCGSEFEETYCEVTSSDGYFIGGYTSFQDAMVHIGEWLDCCEE